MESYKFTCECCKFKCNYNSAWLEHLSSEKHLRQGKPKTHKCTFNGCTHETTIHWNMKMHVMTMHSTIEERSKMKYYCKVCDTVFFSPLYLDKHNIGIKHKNMIKVNELNNQEPNINL